MNPPCLAAALDYLKRGWRPIPLHPPDSKKCKRPGKQPMIKWEYYQRTAMTIEEVVGWWTKCPKANVGVIMGSASGLVGIDIDSPEGADKVIEWAGGAQNIPPTLAFWTPNDGRRLLYAIPKNITLPIMPFSGEKGGESVRILGEGSQTVMPPSELNGISYEWMKDCAPWQIEAAPVPAWLLEVIAGKTTARPTKKAPPMRQNAMERARLYLRRCDEAISGSNGHGQTLKIADKVAVGFGLTDEEAVEVLWEEWNARCRPPWSRAELLHKVVDARKTSLRRPGYLIDEPRRSGTSDTINVDQAEAVTSSSPSGAEAVTGKTQATIEPFTARALLRENLPPLRWIVPGIIPEGGTLLAGRPKGGKSWLLLQAALQLAEGMSVWGSLDCGPPIECLYLALEDGRRRLQSRLQLMCGEGQGPAGLHMITDAPNIADGLIELLSRWLDKHQACKLIMIDTLTRIRKRGGTARGGSMYEVDYDAVAPLTTMGQERGVGVIVSHHTRKPKDVEEDDPFDQISGTTGLGGAADMMLLLKRPIHSQEAALHVRGRDVEDATHRLVWDSCLWKLVGGEGLPPEQQKVMEALQKAGRPLTSLEACDMIGKNLSTVRSILCRMKAAGLIRFSAGRYGLHPLQGDAMDAMDRPN